MARSGNKGRGAARRRGVEQNSEVQKSGGLLSRRSFLGVAGAGAGLAALDYVTGAGVLFEDAPSDFPANRYTPMVERTEASVKAAAEHHGVEYIHFRPSDDVYQKLVDVYYRQVEFEENVQRGDISVRDFERQRAELVGDMDAVDERLWDEFVAFIEEKSADGQTLLLDYFADWCPHCHTLAPNLPEGVAKSQAPDTIIVAVDAVKYEIIANLMKRSAGFPEIQLVRDSEVVGFEAGSLPSSEISSFINNSLNGTSYVPSVPGKDI